MSDKRPMTTEEIGAHRDSLCNSLRFLADECQDTGEAFFLIHASILLQVMASLKLCDPAHSMKLADAVNKIGRERFGI
jgi:hypothetical protein